MKSFPLQSAAIGLVITAIAAGSVLRSVPEASASTYAAVLALMLGVTSVILMSWRNALPTDTVGQLLQRTETPERPRRARVMDSGSR